MYTDTYGNKWFKGNLHLHTTNSDGIKTPEEVWALYQENGYDFLAVTDHWVVSSAGSYKNMLLISGCEFDVGTMPRDGIYHILSIGAKHPPEIKRGFGPQQMIDAIHAAGGYAGLAHPAWSLNTPAQISALHDIDFTEMFNSVSDLPHNARPYSGIILDMMASVGKYFKLIATDDAHFYDDSDRCRSFVYVQAPDCSRESILTAICEGRCYPSQGPRMDVRVEDGVIKVDCDPVDEVIWFSDAAFSPNRSQQGKDITHAEYPILDYETFVRVEIRNSKNQYAWSQYIPVNQH